MPPRVEASSYATQRAAKRHASMQLEVHPTHPCRDPTLRIVKRRLLQNLCELVSRRRRRRRRGGDIRPMHYYASNIWSIRGAMQKARQTKTKKRKKEKKETENRIAKIFFFFCPTYTPIWHRGINDRPVISAFVRHYVCCTPMWIDTR
jgi:hypothetical protein